jgi:hypothetical protein
MSKNKNLPAKIPSQSKIRSLIEVTPTDPTSTPGVRIIDLLNDYQSPKDKKTIMHMVRDVLIDGLSSLKTLVSKDGDVYEAVDHEARLKYALAILDIKGEKTLPEAAGKKMPNIVVVLADGRRIE